MSKTFNRNRKDLQKHNKTPNFRIPQTLADKCTLTNVKEVVKKQWNTIEINNEFISFTTCKNHHNHEGQLKKNSCCK